jgi:hypothetical protein
MATAIDPRLGQYKASHPQHHLTHPHSAHPNQQQHHHLPQLPQLPHPHSRLHQLPPLQPPLQSAHVTYQSPQSLSRHTHDSPTHPYYGHPPPLHQPHLKQSLQSQDHSIDHTLDNDQDSADEDESPHDAELPEDPSNLNSASVLLCFVF